MKSCLLIDSYSALIVPSCRTGSRVISAQPHFYGPILLRFVHLHSAEVDQALEMRVTRIRSPRSYLAVCNWCLATWQSKIIKICPNIPLLENTNWTVSDSIVLWSIHKSTSQRNFGMTEPQSPEVQQNLCEAGSVQQKATSLGSFRAEPASRYGFLSTSSMRQHSFVFLRCTFKNLNGYEIRLALAAQEMTCAPTRYFVDVEDHNRLKFFMFWNMVFTKVAV